MCPGRRTRAVMVQGLFCALRAWIRSIVSSVSLLAVCYTVYSSWWKETVVWLTLPSCTCHSLWLLYHFLTFSSLVLFEERYLFSSTLMPQLYFLVTETNTSRLFFFKFSVKCCYWGETEVLLMDYLMFLKWKCVESYHLFLCITVLYGAHIGVYTHGPVVSKHGNIHSWMRTDPNPN